ncbi:MAG: UPF0175 family protein [Candidatus Aenigmarchaeota archaeon]|nr:UPF0175 family protein [Candidatus Aenigmarchaeota archaeon]
MKDVEKVEKEEHTDRAEAVRKLLSHAIKEWKMKKALELLKDHKISYRKAAEIAEVPYMELWDTAVKHGIDIGLTSEEAKRDIEKWL